MTRFWFWSIDRYFDIGDVRRVDDPSKLCPCAPVVGERQPLMFEHTIADFVQRPPYINASGVLIDGYFQSWKYASAVEYELRQSLRWKPSITSAVSRYRQCRRFDVRIGGRDQGQSGQAVKLFPITPYVNDFHNAEQSR